MFYVQVLKDREGLHSEPYLRLQNPMIWTILLYLEKWTILTNEVITFVFEKDSFENQFYMYYLMPKAVG